MMPIENTRTECEGFEVAKLPGSYLQRKLLLIHIISKILNQVKRKHYTNLDEGS